MVYTCLKGTGEKVTCKGSRNLSLLQCSLNQIGIFICADGWTNWLRLLWTRLQQAASSSVGGTLPKHFSATASPKQMVRNANRNNQAESSLICLQCEWRWYATYRWDHFVDYSWLTGSLIYVHRLGQKFCMWTVYGVTEITICTQMWVWSFGSVWTQMPPCLQMR